MPAADLGPGHIEGLEVPGAADEWKLGCSQTLVALGQLTLLQLASALPGLQRGDVHVRFHRELRFQLEKQEVMAARLVLEPRCGLVSQTARLVLGPGCGPVLKAARLVL